MQSKVVRYALLVLALVASSLAIATGVGPAVVVGGAPAAAADTPPAGLPLSFVETTAADGGVA